MMGKRGSGNRRQPHVTKNYHSKITPENNLIWQK